MGLHDQINAETVAPQKFIWPSLPQMSETQVMIATAFPPVVRQVETKLAAGVPLTLQGPEAGQAVGPCRVFELQTPEQIVRVEAPTSLVDAMLLAAGYDLSIDKLSDETAALVIEHVLRKPLTELEEHLETTISVQVPDADIGASCMGLNAKLADGDEHVLTLSASTEILTQIRDLLSTASKVNAKAQPCPKVPFGASLCTEPLEVSGPDFHALASGDALLLPETWAEPPAAMLTIADTLSAPVKKINGKFQLRKALSLTQSPQSKDDPMTNSAATQTSNPGPTSDALPVQVSLELDRTDIKMGELSRLTTGSILPFEQDLPDTVRLIANGAAFAEGELVQLGDRIGVRLTSRL